MHYHLHISLRWLWIVLAALFLPLTAVAANSTPTVPLTAKERVWLAQHPTIRLGSDTAFPPFEFRDGIGRYQGIAYDYVALLNRMLGISMQVVPGLSWQEVLTGVKEGSVDVLPAVTKTPEREKFLLFATPYIENPLSVVTRKRAPPASGLQDFHGKTLAMVKGYSYVPSIIRRHPEIKALMVDTPKEGLKQVVYGRADGVVIGVGVGSYLIQKSNFLNLHIACDLDIETKSLSVGVRKDWPEFVTILNKAFAAISPAIQQEIRQRWSMTQPSLVDLAAHSTQKNGEEMGLVTQATIAAAVFAVLILLIVLLIRYRVAKSDTIELDSGMLRTVVLVSTLIFVLALALGSWYSLRTIEENTRANIGRNMTAVLASSHEALEVWANLNISFINDVAGKPDLTPLVQQLLAEGHKKERLLVSSALADLRRFMAEHLTSEKYKGFFIIDRDGISLASRRDGNIGSINLIVKNKPELFQRVLRGGTVFVPVLDSEIDELDSSLFFLAPVRNQGGQVIAAMSIRLDPTEDFSHFLKLARLGKSGEVYAVSPQGLLLSESRFDDNLRQLHLLNKGEPSARHVQIRDPGTNLYQRQNGADGLQQASMPLTLSARMIKARHQGVSTMPYHDYRGVSVLGAWLWDENLAIGFIAEIDEDEALSEFNRIRQTVIIMVITTIIMVLFLIGLFFWLSLSATRVLERRVAEKTEGLQRSEDNLHRIFASTPVPLVIARLADGRVLRSNQAMDRFHGLDSAQMLAVSIGEMVVHADAYRELHAALVRGEVVEDRELLLKQLGRDQEERISIVSLLPIDFFDDTAVLLSVVDITERVLAEQKVHSVIDNVADAIIMIDDYGAIHEFSPSAERIFGYDKQEALGKNIKILMPEPVQSQHDGYLSHYRDTGEGERGIVGKEREVVGCRKGGALFPLSLSVQEALLGEERYFIGILRDITAQKEAEAQLIQAKLKAEEATRAKSDFLANMSHEIRTPMNAIMGLTQLALMTKLTPKQQDYLSKVNRSAEALLGIINDILDFSKIEAGKLDMEQVAFDLDDVLDSVSNLIALKATEKGLEFMIAARPDLDTGLIGDPLRLGQILINLGNNALKFTERGEIVILIEELAHQGDRVHLSFSVRDSGIGMSPEQTGKLFQAFSQADGSTTRKYGGTGLGLTISKRLVEMMEGEIGVESEAGVGSRFFFTAWFGRGQAGRARRKVVPETIRHLRVLVVDDNATACEIATSFCRAFGFRCEAVGSGEAALSAVTTADQSREPFDLVLMDWKMPGMDGLECSRRIKGDTAPDRRPVVIMVSGYGRDELMHEIATIGLDGYVAKPVTQSSLLDAILLAFGQGDSEQRSARALGTELDPQVRGARLLLVEDNEINQQVASELLEKAGFFVTIANDGKEGVDLLDHQRFDGVLMDLQMPVMGGIEATRHIRAQDRFNTLPVIAMTANAMAGDREACIEAGMSDHIAKPIEVEELLSTLNRWIVAAEPASLPEESGQHKAEADTIALPSIAGLDCEAGVRRVGGNRKLYHTILRKFRDSQQDAVQQIESTLAAGDRESAIRIAHTLKGVAGNISASRLQQAAQALEQAIKEGQEEGDLAPLYATVAAELNPLIAALQQLDSSKPTVAKREQIDPDLLRDKMAELETLLLDDDTDALDVVDQLLPQVIGTPTEKVLKRIAARIGDYDFEEAVALFVSAQHGDEG